MSNLEIILIGMLIGVVLIAAVFRPNQVGGEGGSRNFISLLFLFVIGSLSFVYIQEKYQTNNAPQADRVETPAPESAPEFRGGDDFNNRFIDPPQNYNQVDKEIALEKQYGGYEDEQPQQYNSRNDSHNTINVKSAVTKPTANSTSIQRDHYVQVGAYRTYEGLYHAISIHQKTYQNNTIHMVNLANSTGNKALYKAMAGPFTLQEAEAFKKQAQLSVKILTTNDLLFLTVSPP